MTGSRALPRPPGAAGPNPASPMAANLYETLWAAADVAHSVGAARQRLDAQGCPALAATLLLWSAEVRPTLPVLWQTVEDFAATWAAIDAVFAARHAPSDIASVLTGLKARAHAQHAQLQTLIQKCVQLAGMAQAVHQANLSRAAEEYPTSAMDAAREALANVQIVLDAHTPSDRTTMVRLRSVEARLPQGLILHVAVPADVPDSALKQAVKDALPNLPDTEVPEEVAALASRLHVTDRFAQTTQRLATATDLAGQIWVDTAATFDPSAVDPDTGPLSPFRLRRQSTIWQETRTIAAEIAQKAPLWLSAAQTDTIDVRSA